MMKSSTRVDEIVRDRIDVPTALPAMGWELWDQEEARRTMTRSYRRWARR